MAGLALHSPKILSGGLFRNGLIMPCSVARKASGICPVGSAQDFEGFGVPGFEPPVISVAVGRGMARPAELCSHVDRLHGLGGDGIWGDQNQTQT